MTNRASCESASMTCPRCNHRFRMLADEYGDHDCPNCGANPSEPMLERDIDVYIENCRKRGYQPDAMAFSLTYQRKYGRVPGNVIAKLLRKGAVKHGTYKTCNI